ncbi:MAG TPA: Asp-tRNA(Asn)/Glu-tRNA(Gln) amidotransferase subunit GatB [Armatimonadota bacterium]|jgi:aspartyl-tRNA(Asn)/glutamyl-tRNA(Gln) amidotransferase subunit B
MAEYELHIGMEVHAELLTASKMFCGCSTHFGAPPNTNVCPVCTGLPGSLPVPNRRAIEMVVRAALALNCEVSSPSVFQRKNYFYPDLPKAYQISQYGNDPIGRNGHLDFMVEGKPKRVRINRVHLEEDTGKLFHVAGGESEVDYNRSGVPLMEIVTEFPPDIRTPEEAREYLVALRAILVALEVCDGRMEQGSLRCEPNISARPVGATGFGKKVELKNLNSFRSVYRGCAYELQRQSALYEAGGTVLQETRRWDDVRGETFVMRSKELEQEYRYFPDPDLVPLLFDATWVEDQREALPELPQARRARFISDFGLPEEDAALLVSDQAMADFFETTCTDAADPKAVSNWMTGDLIRLLSDAKIEIGDSKLAPTHLSHMLSMLDSGAISGKIAKTVFQEMFNTGKTPEEVVEEQGLTQISDEGAIVAAVDQVLAANPKEVERFQAGEEKLLAFFVGQLMKATRGKANPELANRLLKERLSG